MFFFLYKSVTLVDNGAYKPYTLAGPPVKGLVLALLAVHTLTTFYEFLTSV